MPLLETKGAASAQGFGGAGAGASGLVTYIEDVFSTWLYTGNGSTQTITNGIDLSTKGGLVWAKDRDAANSNTLYDTARGVRKTLYSNTTGAQATEATNEGVYAFGTTGFSIGGGSNTSNGSGNKIASWTFRKQPKFFDVVTYTGDGVAGRTVAHNLGSVPGCIVVKGTGSIGYWRVYHRSLGATKNLALNLSDSVDTNTAIWNDTEPTSTNFTLGDNGNVNASGQNYVAYLFAHDAGGFGLTGSDNVISCGSYTGLSTGRTVTLGYEPQWVLVKKTNDTSNWYLMDNMRGMTTYDSAGKNELYPNLNSAEAASSDTAVSPTATGFIVGGGGMSDNGDTYIYIAIRRGPMKVPTDATKVFGLNARSGTGANATVTGGQVDDAVLIKNRGSAVADLMSSRLTGTGYLVTSSTAAEVAAGTTILQANPWDVMDGVKVGTTSTITNASSNTFINYLFRRAPSFFDEVCYSGTGTQNAKQHNLTVTPELIIVKKRTAVGGADGWWVYNKSLPTNYVLRLDGTDAQTDTSGYTYPFFSSVNASTFTVGSADQVNASGETYVSYLFATAAGVSKVGSYTGTGALQTVNCGFTGGARFVLIKRTDSTGDWYVYDSARGISSGNDPYLLLNSTAAEVTGTNYVDTTSVGFQVTAAAPAGLNANGGTYIFLAIA